MTIKFLFFVKRDFCLLRTPEYVRDSYRTFIIISSSSTIPVSVSRRNAHSRAVVFHTLYRGIRDTRFFPYWDTCTILGPSVIPTTLLFPTWPAMPPRLPPIHISVSPLNYLQQNALTLPHSPCPCAPALPFICWPSSSAHCRGCLPPSVTVNLHWPSASSRLQPMPDWPPPTLPDWTP